MENRIRGYQLTKEGLIPLIADLCSATLHIDYEKRELSIILNDKCSVETIIVWTDVEADRQSGKVNDFIRLLYASTKVCLRVSPDLLTNASELGSMAQAIGDRSKELLETYSNTLRQEIYTISFEQLKRAAD